jgi:hypothetical protein
MYNLEQSCLWSLNLSGDLILRNSVFWVKNNVFVGFVYFSEPRVIIFLSSINVPVFVMDTVSVTA